MRHCTSPVRTALVCRSSPSRSAPRFAAAQGGARPERRGAEAATTSTDPVVENFHFRSIGPASMGGRIDDIAVSESNPERDLRRLRRRWRVQVDEQRDDVRAGLHEVQHGVDRRHRDSSDEPEHRVRRHRRAEQSPDVVVRRRHLQDDRRRQDLHEHRPARDADDRAHRDRSAQSRGRVRRRRPATCSARTRTAASTRRPTAARAGTRSSTSTRTPASTTS